MAKTKAMNIIKIDVRAGGAWVFSIDAEEHDTEVTVVGGAVVTVGMVNFSIARAMMIVCGQFLELEKFF